MRATPSAMPSVLDGCDALGVQLTSTTSAPATPRSATSTASPVDTLKIDRSFVGAIGSDDGSAEIVRTIVGLATTSACEVIAEGVETEAQLRKLHELGGRYGQGFLFARPLAPEGVEELLATWEPERFAAAALN